jgi:hypothetical protein
MNSLGASAVAILEDPSQYVIRYGIESDPFARVLSSVTSGCVLLLGVPEYSLIAMIPLSAPVDPDRTTATFEGNELVLRLVKCAERQFEIRPCEKRLSGFPGAR